MGASDIEATGRNAGVAKQIISSGIVSVGSLLGGMMQGWTSPMTLKLQKDDSPVGAMSKGEVANLAAMPAYMGLFLGLSIIFIANKMGRKPALIGLALPTIFGYIIMVFATNQLWLYVGKVVATFGGIGITVSQMYVSETTHESIRGILMSTCTMQINVGILFAYMLGKFLDFKWFNAVYAVVPAVFAALMLLLPETPYFLVSKSKDDDAKKSLLWLRGGDASVADDELHKIKNPNASDSIETEERLTFFQEMKTRATMIALIVSLIGYSLQSFSGITAVINFAGIIFEEAGSPLSADDSSILTAVINLVASFINLFLIDRFGRKPLLYVSFIGGGVSLTVLSFFLYAQQYDLMNVAQVGWIPIGSLGIFIFCYGVGLASVPGVLMNEMTPTNVKPIMGTIIGVVAHLIVFMMIQSFPYLDDNVGLWFCFALPAVCNILGIFFTMFLVRETKGKSLSEIINELNNE